MALGSEIQRTAGFNLAVLSGETRLNESRENP